MAKVFFLLSVLATRANDGDCDSNSPSVSSAEIQSSGNSSLNLSDHADDVQTVEVGRGDKPRQLKETESQ